MKTAYSPDLQRVFGITDQYTGTGGVHSYSCRVNTTPSTSDTVTPGSAKTIQPVQVHPVTTRPTVTQPEVPRPSTIRPFNSRQPTNIQLHDDDIFSRSPTSHQIMPTDKRSRSDDFKKRMDEEFEKEFGH